jgi:hypothetical protein
MPKVGKKTFPYTKSGVAAAKKAASKPSMKKVSAKVKSSDKDVRVTDYVPSGKKPGTGVVRAGKESRSVAQKRGTPIGKTTAETRHDTRNNAHTSSGRTIESKTKIRSARGNIYDVTGVKHEKALMKDSSYTYIRPDAKSVNKRGRDPKFGPAPKVKKKK